MSDRKLTFIDLFAGCGGLSEGFLKSGRYKALAHVEWELPMVDTLRNRLVKKWHHSETDARKRVIRFDVQRTDELLYGNWSKKSVDEYGMDNAPDVSEGGLHGIVGSERVDLIIGGPPCQAYSIAGRAQDPNSMRDDYRNYLFESFVKIVDSFRPNMFVFENVPGILSARPGKKATNPLVTQLIYKAFNDIGYEIRKPEELSKSIYCSADFQVPQKRNRVIIIGVRQDCAIDLETVYESLDNHKIDKPQKTVRDAIGGLPKFRPLAKDRKVGRANVSHELIGTKSVPQHEARYHNSRDRAVFRDWINGDLNNADQSYQLDFYYRITGKRSQHNKYRNLYWDKPSPTIVSHLYKDGLMFIHPDVSQQRSITVREAALLQSFPMDFEFLGSNAYCFKMIGNAVPVDFAMGIANAIYDVMDTNSRPTLTKQKVLNVLVACEESQAVCKEFRRLGHNAYSCDLLPCSGGHPEWHFNCDVLEVIKNKGGVTQDGSAVKIAGEWDIMVAHPPCTYLAVSGARWYYNPEDAHLPFEKRRPHPRFPNRAQDREDGAAFFMALANAPIKRIAIENPVGIMSKRWRKPDQAVQPWWFGDEASKLTCLWLKNLPPLEKTNEVGHGERVVLSSGKSLPKWYSDALVNAKTAEERRTIRSKTFPGFAKAIAEQWSAYVLKELE